MSLPYLLVYEACGPTWQL